MEKVTSARRTDDQEKDIKDIEVNDMITSLIVMIMWLTIGRPTIYRTTKVFPYDFVLEENQPGKFTLLITETEMAYDMTYMTWHDMAWHSWGLGLAGAGTSIFIRHPEKNPFRHNFECEKNIASWKNAKTIKRDGIKEILFPLFSVFSLLIQKLKKTLFTRQKAVNFSAGIHTICHPWLATHSIFLLFRMI